MSIVQRIEVEGSARDVDPAELGVRQVDVSNIWAQIYSDLTISPPPASAESAFQNPASFLDITEFTDLTEDLAWGWQGLLIVSRRIVTQALVSNPDRSQSGNALDDLRACIRDGLVSPSERFAVSHLIRLSAVLFAESIKIHPSKLSGYEEVISESEQAALRVTNSKSLPS